MTLEQAYFITQIIVGIGFIISIVFLAVQLRQNSFLLRNSMADQRRQRIGWLLETLCTDNDFWAFNAPACRLGTQPLLEVLQSNSGNQFRYRH